MPTRKNTTGKSRLQELTERQWDAILRCEIKDSLERIQNYGEVIKRLSYTFREKEIQKTYDNVRIKYFINKRTGELDFDVLEVKCGFIQEN